MKRDFRILIGSLAVLALAAPVFAMDTSTMADKAKAAVTPGEFSLSGTQSKTIHNGKAARTYNVCVKAEATAAPMKVQHDGQSETLQPGDCKDVRGKDIEAMPASALSGDTHIVATFKRVKMAKG